MAARVAARQAKTVARILSPRSSVQAANLTQQRGLADHHGPAKINVWQDPMSPSKWKEEHVSFILIFYTIFMKLYKAILGKNFFLFL